MPSPDLGLALIDLKSKLAGGQEFRMRDSLCLCGEVQDETHVLLHCCLLEDLRRGYQDFDFHSVHALLLHDDAYALCRYIYEVTSRVKCFE